jgi:transcriptional regulator with XRE-family HTH domain
MNDLSNRLILFRKHTNLQRPEFSDKVGINEIILGNWERGRNKPNSESLLLIKKSFPELNIEWLVNGSGEMLLKQQQKQYNVEEKELPIAREPEHNYKTMSESTFERLFKEALKEKETLLIENDRLKNKLEECESRNGSLKTVSPVYA